ncbi:DNA replication licensing factor MCM3 [Pseudolycoriella hygida]|uniref:DNA replication licensing factor MCM3 n=1 Tax=Pseudolycoriella hygida TaxID=35572 RepID=A0A9Q0RXV5_9DIPT|nr:DNA replication licensing factor MCM3 [Pseudolycoriella hygida]
METIKSRLRSRRRYFRPEIEFIDLTEVSEKPIKPSTYGSIETIDLTKVDLPETRQASINPDRLLDSCNVIKMVFEERNKQSMSLLRLSRIVGRVKSINGEKIRKAEIYAALSTMAEENQVLIFDGMVRLI